MAAAHNAVPNGPSARASRASAASREPVDEYERERVPDHALLGLKSFVGQYAGEHVAAPNS